MNEQVKIERHVAAMHQLIAARLRSGDLLPLTRARSNVVRWRSRFGGVLPAAYCEWEALLDAGPDAVLFTLEDDSGNAVRKRSSSPFAGALITQERGQILRHAA